MTRTDFHLHLERRDHQRNMARFYALQVERDMFGTWLATRRWGRIGSIGRTESIPCRTPAEAVAHLKDLATRKTRRGYIPLKDL